ncbi:cupin 2 domain-containing protein [Rhodopseudomonas rhenobacensis]|uniref:Cupin 2 domain-containing protein n=1 Tax=Rhodopseudomonas rhenobacensis TaxID=87461 RepID=A0A7W7Z5I7_9BRAD|nr:cupin domain-containing protein [Rhodopseudomonas rhenobacensis]MBB5048412.1 cupin 2 domain-containing protein [Rhodopseudomonas rhenobacensis]
MIVKDLLDPLPPPGPDESLETLLSRGDVRFERIVSTGQASPPGFWYDQAETEVVVLLAGAATLRFADGDRLIALRAGALVEIPAHARHRVEATQADPPTVWLAVFFP